MSENKSAYGFCPTCGAKGVNRERRPYGNDRCLNGHVYPSSTALENPVKSDVMSEVEVWEIYVPKYTFDGRKISINSHKRWDEKVMEITGGMTIMQPIRGKWEDSVQGVVFNEKMIPVRIACTRNEILDIAKMTASYYDQIEILAYKISDEVLFYRR